MRRKFVVFSSVLFVFIFVLGRVTFFYLMRQILRNNSGNELMRVVEIEELKLEAYVNSEIAIVQKMAASPLIQQYFLNPENEEVARIALEDIEGYRRAFRSNSLFWVNDADKRFYFDDVYAYTVDPDDPAHYWYNMTIHEKVALNININYNPSLQVTNLWINAPVFDKEQKAIGMMGTGIDLSDFNNNIFQNYFGPTQLYLFNALGEITGAQNVELVANKVSIDTELGQAGRDIRAQVRFLKDSEIRFFETRDRREVAAFCRIPALDWNIVLIHHFTVKDTLQTGMTFLFGIMMLVIFSIFIIVNMFVSVLLEPLSRLIKTLSRISNEWDLKPKDENGEKDEVETLGEFLSLTIIDQLTGIYNRRFFHGNMKKIIKTLSRSNGRLSLLLIDIDYFKKYNDTYGHDAGDSCLKTVANALAGCVTREDDFVARYGGEEFAVVLPNTGEDGAGLIAYKILNKMYMCNIPHEKNNVAKIVTVSIGSTAGIVKHFHSESDFIRQADEALYKSKHDGRNRYSFKSLD
jgi:methyl-accepting chemotaxis protein